MSEPTWREEIRWALQDYAKAEGHYKRILREAYDIGLTDDDVGAALAGVYSGTSQVLDMPYRSPREREAERKYQREAAP